MKKILLTGSCGFIGSNFIRSLQGYEVCSVDKIIAPYNLYNVFDHPSHNFYMADIADPHFMNNIFALEKPDIVIHMAAESFVDDSIKNAVPFAHSNVLGTQVMVDMSIKYGVKRFIYVSTDEVYGQLQEGDASWTEESTPRPRNPYSASKMAGEHIVHAASETHGLIYNITRSCNNFGPRQPPRNLVPKVITCGINKKNVPLHGMGKQIREWISVHDHCRAIMTVLEHGKKNEIYNVGSDHELTNLAMIDAISKAMNIGIGVEMVSDRPGHDFRYSVDCSKLLDLGWGTRNSFEFDMAKVVKWYKENEWYHKNILS